MGTCVFCKEPAGWFKKEHSECRQRLERYQTEIIEKVSATAVKGGALKDISEISQKAGFDKETLNALYLSGWERAVDSAFDDGILTDKEEQKLIALAEYFSFSQETLNTNGYYEKLVQGAVLRDILNGEIPQRLYDYGDLPFNFQKNEKLVWLFNDVDYYEEKTHTRYVGGSQGVSIRIAKGFYYRTSGFKGKRVQDTKTIHADTGILGITDKHIYFAGLSKRFRIAYNKIVVFEPFSDGFGVQRDAQTAKLQTFVVGDGWFVYNLVTNLA